MSTPHSAAAPGGTARTAEPAPSSRIDGGEEVWFRPLIPRQTLKQLMKRSDAESLKNFGLWLALLAASGAVAAYSWGTWWALPAFFVYGTIYCSSDARWHELGHGTPFKTSWLNQAFYQLCSFMTIREATLWKWSHARHHTHTIISGRDPEIQVERPPRLHEIALDFFYLVGGTKEIIKIVRHACGSIAPEIADFVPASERRKMIWISRAYVVVIVALIAWCVSIQSILPLLFVWTPRFYCGWFHQTLGLTQHAGLAMNVTDHRLNTRTVYLNPVFRFLYMNMNYHVEHHMLPMVPYHALPRLHEAIRSQTPTPYPNLWSAYREMVPALIRQTRDRSYFIRREVTEGDPLRHNG
ncbi:fatty acid desaturase [Trinickia violacea]|uniref:Fatty acid desaturase n=1 Tax=Trinickia violacea TaxID=2571746 RepID=A0A4P8IXP4_9BURK|nr:fatty acid desaturase family protein [Trinickia violacea]QCP54082.1 fatty acid desaturase [Trinickia violacea]